LFKEFKDQVECQWNDFKASTSNDFVDYDKDLNTPATIDYDKGQVEVEVIVEDKPSLMNKKNVDVIGRTKLQKKFNDILKARDGGNHLLVEGQLTNGNVDIITGKTV